MERLACDADHETVETPLHVEREAAIRCVRAVDIAAKTGLYAIPVRRSDDCYYWAPRMPNGKDPELGWLLNARPSRWGWPTWADAVLSLAEHLAT